MANFDVNWIFGKKKDKYLLICRDKMVNEMVVM